MKRKISTIVSIVLASQLMYCAYAFAFIDVNGGKYEQEILALKEAGILQGVGDDLFFPNKPLTYAEGISLIVRAFQLNLEDFAFIKEPTTKDYYKYIDNNKWYSKSFVIAHLNGVPISNDIRPDDILTKEVFAHMLFETMRQEGDYVFIEMWKIINDEKQIDKNYMNSIQKLLITGIIHLDEVGNFLPNKEISRNTAAKWVKEMMDFIRSN